MKKDFHVFFLFSLLALFAVNAAWATCPEGLQEDAVTGDCYFNMPLPGAGAPYLVLSTVTPFKIYGDGGKDGIYSSDASGALLLQAPEEYVFHVSGSIDAAKAWFGIAYDGNWVVDMSCDDKCSDVDAYLGSYIQINFESYSTNESHTGPNLTVNFVHVTENADAAELSNEGGLHIDMPKTGAKALTIPNDVVSFKVYDDGGKTERYAYNASGFLVLTAPEGKKLLLTGSVTTDFYDNLTVFDGGINDQKLLDAVSSKSDGETYDIGAVLSSGKTLTLWFKSDASRVFDGLDLNVLVVTDMTNPNKIEVNDVNGGKAKALVSSEKVTSAVAGTEVEVSVTLDDGFLLQDLIVSHENGLISVNRSGWPFSNTATFIMPGTDVTITPVIVPSNEVYVNMPNNSTEKMDVVVGGAFHIYSDGGKDGAYSNDADGSLKLIAPDGYVLQLTGNIKTQAGNDFLTVYDGDNHQRTLLKNGSSASDGATFDIGTLVSSGRYMELNFKSDAEFNYAGLDLVVSAVSRSGHNVVVNGLGENGTLVGETNDILPGEVVKLTVTPNDGYFLDGVVATDKWGNTLDVTGGIWYSSNDISFVMPSSDVNVSVDLSNEPHINMPLPGAGAPYLVLSTVTPFKIYGDGGKDGIYSSDASGALLLQAPEEYVFHVSGSIDAAKAWFGIAYDGNWVVDMSCDDKCSDVDAYLGSYIQINFESYSTNESHTGPNLTVNFVHVTENADAAELSNEGGLHIDMPKTGAKALTIPNDVVSFKVYDDGGKTERYAYNASGFLVLTAPEGKKLLLTGSVTTDFYDNLTVFDGGINDQKLLDAVSSKSDGETYDIGAVLSSGKTLTLWFKSDASRVFDGLDLKVSVVDEPTKYAAVSVVEDESHKKYGIIDGNFKGTDAINITEEIAVENVVFNRPFSTSGFSTLMLPFSFNAKNFENVESVIEFDGMTTNDKDELAVGMRYVWCSAEVEEYLESKADPSTPEEYEHCNSKSDVFTGEMTAYTPYMVQMGGSELVFKEGATLEVTPAKLSGASDGSGWTFMPVLQKKVFTKEETKDGRIWGFAGEERNGATIGKFVRFGKGAYVQPFRAYLVSDKPQLVSASPNAQYVARPAVGETASLPENIDVVIVSRGNDGEKHTTTIGKFNTRTGEFKMLRDYDLKGRKTNIMNRAQGAYYGKKVLKK